MHRLTFNDPGDRIVFPKLVRRQRDVKILSFFTNKFIISIEFRLNYELITRAYSST